MMNSTFDSNVTSRDLRQRDLVPPQRLAECQALVIGVGAIGRQVALQLAAIGVPCLTLYDHDTVQVENLASQGFWFEDLELTKVRATGAVCRQINPDLKLTLVPERFKRSTVRDLRQEGRLAVFVCVDSIAGRQLIWEALRLQAAFFVDGRMSAEVIRVLAVAHPATDRHYAGSLFQSEQAYSGSCTAKSTIYTASIAAGLMLGQFTRWLRRLPVDADLMLNLLASELAVIGPVGDDGRR
jgi:molybdopterin-synthase adenylyltransferase